MASGWNFFGIGIFYFGPDRGSGFENLEKSREKNPGDRDFKISKKSRVLGFQDFLTIGIF